MPKVDPKTLAKSIARSAEQNSVPADRAPKRHPNRAPQNYTTNSPKRQADKPGAFGRHAVNGAHAAPKAAREYAEGVEVAVSPSGDVRRVFDASDRYWRSLFKQVSKGARVTVRR